MSAVLLPPVRVISGKLRRHPGTPAGSLGSTPPIPSHPRAESPWPARSGRRGQPAFSLLEVILATAIVAASSMVLTRLISTGAQHQDRATRKAIGQLICQSLIDEWTVSPAQRENVEHQQVPGFPGWTYTALVEPTDFAGVVRVRIRAAELPVGSATAADPERFDFELVRWMRAATESPQGGVP